MMGKLKGLGSAAVMVAALAVPYLAACQNELPAEYGYIVKLGQAVPGFELELQDGSTVDVESLRGKVVMLQFTASWCGECRARIPRIESEIWGSFRDNPDFSLYAVQVKDLKGNVLRLRKETGFSYPVALDPDAEVFSLFSGAGGGVPRAVIIDRTGTIVFATGWYTNQEFDEMKRLIGELLGERVKGTGVTGGHGTRPESAELSSSK